MLMNQVQRNSSLAHKRAKRSIYNWLEIRLSTRNYIYNWCKFKFPWLITREFHLFKKILDSLYVSVIKCIYICMLILKNPSCKVHISECHQPHWVTPCQLDLPVEFKNSHLICLFIRHASILPNTQKFLQESRFSGYYRGYVGSQKTMTTSSVALKKKNTFSIEQHI